ncbi:uncharacterized protein YjdB [Clostridium acetobutylicum]|uniref:Ig-like domain-containing protein n=1 Tax=Clostridium TaxID=1485 RepID=UPI000200A6E7|nr:MULTISPECIES: Ig domain-containing protein [Clostridium]ADZ21158.1 Contains cell adhesion domain protein [Clostridium acetobutylicum EA 2018]AEI32186.1 cell adhesion domain-containing protein [Clostridium acetobutylicum DSM 1731]AWV79507.1 hypothetical protein DK921_05210 [Clostridium acetobutylicum]MBC2394520.1 Ig domain-containing protein [Clostridium acetobutylicum]MBC2583482.1 Ig domain-containing protein [Clostridium acetobutylicum]
MKNKFKVSLVVFLIVILGCFTSVFADNTNDGNEIGKSNFNNTVDNSAKVGDQLLHPEIGWKRVDDNNKNFTYSSSMGAITDSRDYNSTAHTTISKNQSYAEIKFRFYGSKLRIIACTWQDHSKKIYVDIDGNIEVYNPSVKNQFVTLAYEKSDLQLKCHDVKIYTDVKGDPNVVNGVWFNLDAIDIDSTGYLVDSESTLATGITLNKNTSSLEVGQTDTLTAAVTPNDTTNKAVTWTSSDPNVVTVDSNGKVTAVKEGKATITAVTQDGSNLSVQCTINVINSTTISLNKTTDSINVGQTDNLLADVSPSTEGVTWTSSDSSVVTVDGSGKITGVKEGQATITAATADGKTSKCTVTVSQEVNTDKAVLSITMTNGQTKQFNVTMDVVNKFIDWYKLRAAGSGDPFFQFDITDPSKPNVVKTDYIIFDKISSFEVDNYK